MASAAGTKRLREIEDEALANEAEIDARVREASHHGVVLVVVADLDGVVEARHAGDGHLACLLDAQAARFAEIVGTERMVRLGSRLLAVCTGADRAEVRACFTEIETPVTESLSARVAGPSGPLFAGVLLSREIVEAPDDADATIRRLIDRVGTHRRLTHLYLARLLAQAETYQDVARWVVGAGRRAGLTSLTVTDADRRVLAASGDPSGRVPDIVHRVGTQVQLTIEVWLPEEEWDRDQVAWSRSEAEFLLESAAITVGAAVDRVAALESVRQDAERDELTGVLNRAGLRRALRHLSGPFAVVMADVDHLKRVNDTHGHAAGDEVIRSLATRLAGTRADDLVSRWGGEEFVVVLRGATAEAAAAWLRRILADGPSASTVSFSAGVAACPGAHDFDVALQAADAALYAAKRDGRARVYLADLPAGSATA